MKKSTKKTITNMSNHAMTASYVSMVLPSVIEAVKTVAKKTDIATAVKSTSKTTAIGLILGAAGIAGKIVVAADDAYQEVTKKKDKEVKKNDIIDLDEEDFEGDSDLDEEEEITPDPKDAEKLHKAAEEELDKIKKDSKKPASKKTKKTEEPKKEEEETVSSEEELDNTLTPETT